MLPDWLLLLLKRQVFESCFVCFGRIQGIKNFINFLCSVP